MDKMINSTFQIISFGCDDNGQLGQESSMKKEPRKNSSEDDELTQHNIGVVQIPSFIKDNVEIEITAVSCGSRHSMALSKCGNVFSWGWGKMGQLGHGDDRSLSAPKLIQWFLAESLKIKYISSGGCHSGAISLEGRIYMWGEAHWGQLGVPCKHHHQLYPKQCSIFAEGDKDSIVRLSCGGTHTAALSNNGKVFCWGRADNGQLGIGKSWLENKESGILSVNSPHIVEGFQGEKVSQVACGAFHTIALTETGKVFIWGKEDYGMLGLGHTSDVHRPTPIDLFNKNPARFVSCGGWHTIVITREGACYSFGRGEYGRLGLGDSKSRCRPEKIQALNCPVVQVSCGGTHTLFFTEDDKAYSAGRPNHFRLGVAVKREANTPQLLSELMYNGLSIKQVSAGGAHSMVLFQRSK